MTTAAPLQLQFGPELPADAVLAGLLGLSGATDTSRRVSRLIAHGTSSGVKHLFIPASGVDGSQLVGHLDGVQLVEHEPLPSVPYVWRLWLSSSRRPLAFDRPEVTSRALLQALSAPMAPHESVRLEWQLGPVARPQAIGTSHAPQLSESWVRALASAPFAAPGELDYDARRALRTKRAAFPGWHAAGYIAVDAKSRSRAQQLAAGMLAALRTADAASAHFGVRRGLARSLDRGPWRFNLWLSTPELVGLLAFPIGLAGDGLPVAQRRARLLAAPVATRRQAGRRIGTAVVGDHPVWLAERAANMHTYVLGPTGSGKSTWLASQILQDIEAGRGVVAIDAKGQFVDEVLARYPASRDTDLVVISPQDSRPVGINPFVRAGEAALLADQHLEIFAQLYADSWGPRTSDVLHASLLTLAHSGSGSLASLPLLLTSPGYRRQIVGKINDPLGVGPFWQWYEGLSPEMRQQVIGPVMNKIRPFIVRPALRGVLGQTEPRFHIQDALTKRRVVLVDLAKGLLGPGASALLGTVFLNMLWQATLGRAALPPDRLQPVSLYIDEAQDFLRLPFDLGDMLAQARSLKLSITVAHQHLSQMPTDTREALLAGARSRVLFQLGSRDAGVLAQGHRELTPTDLSGLPRFETYSSLVVNDEVTPYSSIRTSALSAPTRDPRALRAASAERYGRDRRETDAALERLSEPASKGGQIGERRRRQS
jgi:hypothetical protein